MIQMLHVGSGVGWRTLPRLWSLTTSSTRGCCWWWWAPASSCFSWCSGRSVNAMSGGRTAWPSSASGVSAVCSVPPGLSFSFLLEPQKPACSSSASLTRYKVSFWVVSLLSCCHTDRAEGQRHKRHCLCGRNFLCRWNQNKMFLLCVYFLNCCCWTARDSVWSLVCVSENLHLNKI